MGNISLIKSDVRCDECGAFFRRIELMSQPSPKGEFRCPLCNRVLEVFDGSHSVLYRLVVASAKAPVIEPTDEAHTSQPDLN